MPSIEAARIYRVVRADGLTAGKYGRQCNRGELEQAARLERLVYEAQGMG
jgi:hypothetical protein